MHRVICSACVRACLDPLSYPLVFRMRNFTGAGESNVPRKRPGAQGFGLYRARLQSSWGTSLSRDSFGKRSMDYLGHI